MKSSLSSKCYDEILSQPDVLRHILNGSEKQIEKAKSLYKVSEHERIILTGCGTTYALGVCAADFFRHYGVDAFAYPASELAFYPELRFDRAKLLVAISRSGMTSETLWAVNSFREHSPDGKVCAITTQNDSTLAGLADIVLDASPAKEQSIVETRSFTAMLLLAQLFAASLCDDRAFRMRVHALPDTLQSCMPSFMELAGKISNILPLNRFFFLGGGPSFGIACESAFKIKEFTTDRGEAFHPLEFRHGPMTAVNENALVVLFFSDRQTEAELQVLIEMRTKGGHTLAILENASPLVLSELDYTIALASGLDEFERIVLYLPLIQLVAYHRSLAIGLDPDNPQNLKAVTEL
jgi:glutamine---fructose-6-phosphate transaminase (isomerizing)